VTWLAWDMCTVMALSSAGIFTASIEEETVFTRTEVVEAATGEVELRRAYSQWLALPEAECEGGVFTCVANQMYGQVYSLAFFEERISAQREAAATPERRTRGRLLIALNLSAESEEQFERALVARLEGLSVASYSSPRAGMGYLRDPLSMNALTQSTLPAWVCEELDGEYSFDYLVHRETSDSARSGAGEVADLACRTIEGAVEDVSVEIRKTMPGIRKQIRHAVRLLSVSTLAGATWADELAPVPDELTFEKRALPGRKSGSIRDVRDGSFRGHEGRYNDIERDVLIPPAALRLLGVPMWVTQWSFASIRETLGAHPEVVHDPMASIVVAVVPVADPLMPELSRARTMLEAPEKELVGRAVAVFEHDAVLAPSLVERAFSDPEIWPARGDWLVVSCHDDGSARYGIAPFVAAARVTNPEEACGVIMKALGR